jgi:hypothetical protein
MKEHLQFNRKRRCPECQQWSEGNLHHCPNCNAILDTATHDRRLKFIAELRKKRDARDAEALLPPFKRGMKSFFRTLETIYITFIAIVAWFLFWLPG